MTTNTIIGCGILVLSLVMFYAWWAKWLPNKFLQISDQIASVLSFGIALFLLIFQPTHTDTPLIYAVSVQSSSTLAYLANVKVILTVDNMAPQQSYTDVNGYARFTVSQSNENTIAQVVVQLDGYMAYSQYIDLNSMHKSVPIQLQPIP